MCNEFGKVVNCRTREAHQGARCCYCQAGLPWMTWYTRHRVSRFDKQEDVRVHKQGERKALRCTSDCPGHVVLNAMSGNAGMRWSLDETERVLGIASVSDSSRD